MQIKKLGSLSNHREHLGSVVVSYICSYMCVRVLWVSKQKRKRPEIRYTHFRRAHLKRFFSKINPGGARLEKLQGQVDSRISPSDFLVVMTFYDSMLSDVLHGYLLYLRINCLAFNLIMIDLTYH